MSYKKQRTSSDLADTNDKVKVTFSEPIVVKDAFRKSSLPNSPLPNKVVNLANTAPVVSHPEDRDEHKNRDEFHDFEAIADQDDLDITPWQRQMRVNKFMLDVGIRKMISSMLEPVYLSQNNIELKLMTTINDNLGNIDLRLNCLEEDVYNKESRNDRIMRLEQRIQDEELQRKLVVSDQETQINVIAAKMDTALQALNIMERKFNITESLVNDTYKFVDGFDARVKGMMDRTILQVETFMRYSNDSFKGLNTRCESLFQSQVQSNLELSKCMSEVQQLITTDENLKEKVQELSDAVKLMKTSKADQQVFSEFHQKSLKNQIATNEQMDFCINQVKSCSNYMEKYMPLYIQRQITDFMEYLFTERHMRWRINWYNEVKIPMLTAAILFDNGQESLDERINILHELVTKQELPPLPNDKLVLTAEEEFMQIALRNRQVHARAKLIIMQMLNQIQNPDKKISGTKTKILDYSKVTVTQIFNEMLSIIKAENPGLVEQMLLEGQINEDVIQEDQKVMEEELANDNSLEAKIEREVLKVVKLSEKELQGKIESAEQNLYDLIKRQQQVGIDQMNQRSDQIQDYIQEVHNFQIMEMANFKDCHTQYLNSAQQFDRKLQAVIGIENSNLTILKQLKTLNELVSELSAANITAFSETNILTKDLIAGPPSRKLTMSNNQIIGDTVASERSNTQPDQKAPPGSTVKLVNRKILNSRNFISGLSPLEQKDLLTSDNEAEPLAIQQTNGRPQTQIKQQRSRVSSQTPIPPNRISSQTPILAQKSAQEVKFQNAVGIEGRGILKARNSLIGSERFNQSSLSSTFNKLKQTAMRNSNALGSMILDQDIGVAAEIARKAKSRTEKRMKNQPQLPSTEDFKRSLLEFKDRVSDTRIGDRYNKNTMARMMPTEKTAAKKTQPIVLDLGNENKITFGIRRDKDDDQGNKYQRAPDNQQLFSEPVNKEGHVNSFNRAAGLEHQFGKHRDQLVFDKKAVINSMSMK